jgi:hypothetical protein
MRPLTSGLDPPQVLTFSGWSSALAATRRVAGGWVAGGYFAAVVVAGPVVGVAFFLAVKRIDSGPSLPPRHKKSF